MAGRHWLKRKVALHRSLSPHRSFRRTHKHDQPRPARVKPSWRLMGEVMGLLRRQPKLFFGLTLVFVLVNGALIGITDQVDYLGLKDAVASVEGVTGWDKALSVFASVLDGALNPELTTTQEIVYSLTLLLSFLAYTWAARQASAGERVTVRAALYNSPSAFTTTLLIGVIAGAQTLPAAIGIFVLSIAYTGGFLNDPAVAVTLGTLAGLLITLSLYWLITTVVGFVIVSLPPMYPLAALGSAKRLVLGRRVAVFARLVGLFVWSLVLWTVILVPLLLLDVMTNLDTVPLIPFALALLGGVTVMIGSLYLYRLYRALL